MTRLSIICGAAALALAATPAFAQHDPPASSTVNSKNEFIQMSAQNDMAEISLARLATQNSQSGAVKQFAQRLITDHTKDEQNVKRLAEKEHVTLPSTPNKEQQALEQQLSGVTGSRFDREFLKAEIQGHKDEIADYQTTVRATSDPSVKQYAENAVPTLQEHLRLAERTEQKLAGK